MPPPDNDGVAGATIQDFGSLSAAFAQALSNGEIATAFQPKVTLATRELIGVEALARWTSPAFGLVSPAMFVRLAERDGLIGALTDLVLRDALETCALLRTHALGVTMAVNLSPLLLSTSDLPEQIDRALARAGVPPEALIVEVTEGRMIGDMDRARSILQALRDRGIGCAIDDFGTGHASLLSLLRLPFSELKIDRAFVAGCATDPEAAMIVRATLGLAHEMELNVVAEGIETADTEARLRDFGCVSGQGYRYGRPMQADAVVGCFAAAN